MSELSEDKTTRKIIKAMQDYRPVYQISFMCGDYRDASKMLDAFRGIRKCTSAKFKGITLIWWLRLYSYSTVYIRNANKNNRYVQAPMFQIFSTAKLNVSILEEIMDKKSGLSLQVAQRKFSEKMLANWCRTVKKENLYNIQKYFTTPNINRFAITNK